MIFFFRPETQRYTRPERSEHIGSSPGDKNRIDVPSGGRKREVNPLPWMMCSVFFIFYFFYRMDLGFIWMHGSYDYAHMCHIGRVCSCEALRWMNAVSDCGLVRAADRQSVWSIFNRMTAAELHCGDSLVWGACCDCCDVSGWIWVPNFCVLRSDLRFASLRCFLSISRLDLSWSLR